MDELEATAAKREHGESSSEESSINKVVKVDAAAAAADSEFPQTRRVVVRFASGLEVSGRIMYRETWGILVRLDEVPAGATSPQGAIRSGDKYWTKWGGLTTQVERVPIVEAVHRVD